MAGLKRRGGTDFATQKTNASNRLLAFVFNGQDLRETTMYRKILAATTIGACTFAMSPVDAQQPQPGTAIPQTSTQQGTNQGDQAKNKLIAQWLAADNHVEIEIAKIAKENAKSDDVKKFAKTICDDHEKAKERLSKAVPGSLLDMSDDRSSNAGSTQGSQSQQTQPAGQFAANQSSGSMDASKLKKKIAQKRVEMLKKELKDKDGEDFDAAFLAYQLVHHQNMLASLSVLEGETNGELQKAVKEGRKSAEDHYEKAKELMKDLKG